MECPALLVDLQPGHLDMKVYGLCGLHGSRNVDQGVRTTSSDWLGVLKGS